MTDGNVLTVKRRKAVAGLARSGASAMTPAKALKQALAKAAQDLMDLALRVPQLTETRVTQAELPEALDDKALLIIIEGPGEGLGLLAVSPGLLSGLIEIQTMGRLGAGAVQPRRATRTDAAMVAGFIDATLTALEDLVVTEPDFAWAVGYRYASWLDDPRPLGLILEETSFRMFRIGVELGVDGRRQGEILLAMPAEGRARRPARAAVGRARGSGTDGHGPDPVSRAQDAATAAAAMAWSVRLDRAVMESQTEVRAVLHRLSLPIGDVMALMPGSVLPVPRNALEQLSIEGTDGQELAIGRLGQAVGRRAIRLLLSDSRHDAAIGIRSEIAAASRQAQGAPDTLAGRSPYPPAAPVPDIPAPQPLMLDLAMPLDFNTAQEAPLSADDAAGFGDLPMAPMQMGVAF